MKRICGIAITGEKHRTQTLVARRSGNQAKNDDDDDDDDDVCVCVCR